MVDPLVRLHLLNFHLINSSISPVQIPITVLIFVELKVQLPTCLLDNSVLSLCGAENQLWQWFLIHLSVFIIFVIICSILYGFSHYLCRLRLLLLLVKKALMVELLGLSLSLGLRIRYFGLMLEAWTLCGRWRLTGLSHTIRYSLHGSPCVKSLKVEI